MIEFIHGHENLIGTLAGLSLLLPFSLFIVDLSAHPEHYFLNHDENDSDD
jgi:hypothetical protein